MSLLSNVKESNPKDVVGITKSPISTLPIQVVHEVGVAMFEGALKYGKHNYREAGTRATVYYDATQRHLNAWMEGEDIDPDSGLSHITKAIASLMVLRDSMLNENWVDDRPPKPINSNWMQELNQKVKALIEKYPDPKEPFTQKRKEQNEL
jgi:hypothetical protein